MTKRTFMELGPGLSQLLEPPDDVRQARRAPEVLLLQAELLADHVVVVGVQDTGERLGAVAGLDGLFVITGCRSEKQRFAFRIFWLDQISTASNVPLKELRSKPRLGLASGKEEQH